MPLARSTPTSLRVPRSLTHQISSILIRGFSAEEKVEDLGMIDGDKLIPGMRIFVRVHVIFYRYGTYI